MVDGYSLAHLSKRLNVAGRHVTAYLVELLMRRGYALNRCGGAGDSSCRDSRWCRHSLML